MGKNDLSAIKMPQKNILPTEVKVSTAGRKKKAPEDKESKLIPLKLTPGEFAILEEKAGLVKVATYLKHLIRTDTDWLKDNNG